MTHQYVSEFPCDICYQSGIVDHDTAPEAIHALVFDGWQNLNGTQICPTCVVRIFTGYIEWFASRMGSGNPPPAEFDPMALLDYPGPPSDSD